MICAFESHFRHYLQMSIESLHFKNNFHEITSLHNASWCLKTQIFGRFPKIGPVSRVRLNSKNPGVRLAAAMVPQK
jgi:hypothetical protein